MTTSKTDYEKLAAVLFGFKNHMLPDTYSALVGDIGRMYQKDNERFNMRLWLKACGKK